MTFQLPRVLVIVDDDDEDDDVDADPDERALEAVVAELDELSSVAFVVDDPCVGDGVAWEAAPLARAATAPPIPKKATTLRIPLAIRVRRAGLRRRFRDGALAGGRFAVSSCSSTGPPYGPAVVTTCR